jgi:hypothetical protein
MLSFASTYISVSQTVFLETVVFARFEEAFREKKKIKKTENTSFNYI